MSTNSMTKRLSTHLTTALPEASDWNITIGHFVLEGRYYYGVGDMYGNSKKDPFSRSANSTIHIKLAYLFDIKK